MTLLNTIEIKERKAGKTIHIISGAGTGTQLMYTLLSKGYEVTAGVLNVLDSDHDTATMLNIKAISEAPFSPITPEAYSQNLEAMNKADIIVVSDVPVGWGNLKNIQALEEISGKKPVILLIPDMQENKDFTGGEASKIISKIFSKGARKTSDIKGMIDLIEDISGRAS
jgi:iron complex transport system ATP-binding protein